MFVKMNITAVALLPLLASAAAQMSGQSLFDITKYGAQADGKSDISQALLQAWKDACGSPNASTVMIPGGTYALGQISLEGPCNATINFIVEGAVNAPAEISRFEHTESGWISFSHINNLTLSGYGVFDGQGQSLWGQELPRPANMRFEFLNNSMVRDITSKDSKRFHINAFGCKNLSFYNVTISAPEDSPNTDGIHIGGSMGINITDTTIGTGDDCISIVDGSQEISIQRVSCGPGHGISVGSLGKDSDEAPVVGVTVKNCTLTNTMNGVRIKSWPASFPGKASEIHFQDIIMNSVGNPIIIDQEYCPDDECNSKSPSLVQISNVSFEDIRGTSSTQVAVTLDCSEKVPCQNVELSNITLEYQGKGGPAFSRCKNIKPILTGTQLPRACA